jgi:beta-mannosidase
MYSTTDSLKIWNDYQNLFEKVIPSIISKSDPHRVYWPSSPQHGWGRKESLKEGDLHYWGVWWGMEPFRKYQEKVGRFMSEYGFQGMPAPTLFKKISKEENITLQSEVVKNHQKHPTGYQTIDEYLLRDYKKPKSFENYCYVSQLVQAEGMKVAIEAHRTSQPYCMGTMYWQLNDCWPVTSWSSMDYFGTPKASQYFIKEAYRNEILSIRYDKGKYKIISIADDPSTEKVILKISIMNFNGVSQWSTEKEVDAYASGSNILHVIDSAEVMQKINPTCSFMLAELHSPSGTSISSNSHFFTQPKNLCLEKPVIIAKASKKKNSFIISSNVLVKNVFIDGGDGVIFSENYFDLIPGASKEIDITGSQSFQQLKKKIKIKSLYDTY